MKNHSSKPQQSISRRKFLYIGALASVVSPALFQTGCQQHLPRGIKDEWKNKQEGMAYRRLGRTGLMISEVVNGGDPVRLDNTEAVQIAMEKGLNYIDMAPAYGKGECENAYAKIIDTPSKRDKVFMTTKVSAFKNVRFRMYEEVYKGLTSSKKNAIAQKAKSMRLLRGVDIPGYYLTYWPGQDRSMDPTYLCNAMQEDYGHLVDGSKAFRSTIIRSVEESLKRTGTDHFDILMCPHGANSPEEVNIPEINETFQFLKKAGKVRYLGVSTHNDPAGVMKAAVETGNYDVVMAAYNIINGGYMDEAIKYAYKNNVGVIGMKVAMAVATHHEAIKPIPEWRIQKVNRIVQGDWNVPQKAYLWALQNHRISAVISNLWDQKHVEENLAVVGKVIDLHAG